MKGEPYGKVKERARYMLEDLTDAECREVLYRLVESSPGPTLDGITAYWAEVVEPVKSLLRQFGFEVTKWQRSILSRYLNTTART